MTETTSKREKNCLLQTSGKSLLLHGHTHTHTQTNNTTSFIVQLSNFAQRTTTMAVNLPEIVIGHILSFLVLEDLVKTTRRISKTFQKVSDEDERWIPVIAPPNLAHVKLDIKKHGQILRRVYCQYLKFHLEMKNNKYLQSKDSNHKIPEVTVIDRADGYAFYCGAKILVDNNTNLHAFFSLAPWFRRTDLLKHNTCQLTKYPTPWLHKMVYDQPCPTTIAENDKSSLRSLNPDKKNFFFQGKSSHRPWFIIPSCPIDPSIEYSNILPTHPTIKRVVIQPLNLRKLGSGERFSPVNDLNMEFIQELNDASKKVLECYLGDGNVVVNPLRQHHVSTDKVIRYGYGAHLDPHALYNFLGHHLFTDSSRGICDDTAIIFVITPRIHTGRIISPVFVRDLQRSACVWSMPKDDFWGMGNDAVPMALRCVFLSFLPSYTCGNANCALSCGSGCKFILCPMCLRRLDLAGVIQDVPRSLKKLACLLQQDPFSICSPFSIYSSYLWEDVPTLTRYGCIVPDDSSKEKKKRN